MVHYKKRRCRYVFLRASHKTGLRICAEILTCQVSGGVHVVEIEQQLQGGNIESGLAASSHHSDY